MREEESKYSLYDELLEYYNANLNDANYRYETSESKEYPLYEELVDYYLEK